MTPTSNQLSRDAIVRAALRLIDAQGAQALTMRRLAGELGAGVMSLYTYFPDKEAVLGAVVQAVLAEVETPDDHGMGWQQQVTGMMRSFRDVAHRHPYVAELLPRFPPREPAVLRVVEAGLDSLRRGGFPPETAAHAYRLMSSYAVGQVLLESSGFFRHDDSTLDQTDPRLGDLTRYFPRLAEAATQLEKYDAEEEFELGLTYILSGLRADLEGRELSTLQARLAAIVQSSDDAIIGKTPQGIITSWNPGAERLYGYASDETVGRSIGIIIPRHRRDEQQEILDRISAGDRVDHYETERVRKDGRLLWVSLSVSPIVDGTGTIVGASAIARPITPPADTLSSTSARRRSPRRGRA